MQQSKNFRALADGAVGKLCVGRTANERRVEVSGGGRGAAAVVWRWLWTALRRRLQDALRRWLWAALRRRLRDALRRWLWGTLNRAPASAHSYLSAL